MEDYLDKVRVTTPDAGTESGMNDVEDILRVWIDGAATPEAIAGLKGTFLFPMSFWIHEPMRLFDLMLRAALHSIPWLNELFGGLKEYLAYLRDDGRREELQMRAKKLDRELAKALIKRPASIYRLRWGSICKGALDAYRARPAVALVWDLQRCKFIGAEARQFDKLQNSDEFFTKVRETLKLVEDIEDERGFTRGCKCCGDKNREFAKKVMTWKRPNNAKREERPGSSEEARGGPP